jgi:hypothetical protein
MTARYWLALIFTTAIFMFCITMFNEILGNPKWVERAVGWPLCGVLGFFGASSYEGQKRKEA